MKKDKVLARKPNRILVVFDGKSKNTLFIRDFTGKG